MLYLLMSVKSRAKIGHIEVERFWGGEITFSLLIYQSQHITTEDKTEGNCVRKIVLCQSPKWWWRDALHPLFTSLNLVERKMKLEDILVERLCCIRFSSGEDLYFLSIRFRVLGCSPTFPPV